MPQTPTLCHDSTGSGLILYQVIIFYAVATCALVAWLCNMKAMSTWCKQPPSCLSHAIGTGVSEPLPTCVHAQTI